MAVCIRLNCWWVALSVELCGDYTHTYTQPYYGTMDFVWDNPGEPVPEETYTHSHLSWSAIVPYLLRPSNTIRVVISCVDLCTEGGSTGSIDQQQHGSSFSHRWVTLYYHVIIFLKITTSCWQYDSVKAAGTVCSDSVSLCITAELMASHNSLDPAVARSSTTAPVDMRFPPGATATRQQQVLVDQLQQQQQQQRLLSSLGGILSSNLPINANQLQVSISFCSHSLYSSRW